MTDLRVPLTLEQEWFFARRIADGGAPMMITRALDIDGPLDVGRFITAFRSVVNRHQGMRTTIGIGERGEPHQVIHPPSDDIPLICQAIASRSREQFEAYAKRVAWADRISRRNPVRDPMYRMRLLRRSENEHVLLASFDHIAFDDRAIELFFYYLWAEYSSEPGMAAGAGAPAGAGDLAATVRAEHDRYASRAAGVNARYWAGRYALAPASWVADGTDEQRAEAGYERGTANVTLAAKQAAKVRAAARQAGVSTLDVCVSVFAWTVFRLTVRDRVAIYLPFDNRGPAQRGVIGNFACVRPLIVDRVHGSAEAYLGQVAAQVLRALTHRHLDGQSERHCEQLQLAAAQTASARRSLALDYLRKDGVEIPAAPATGLSVRRARYSPQPPAAVPESLVLFIGDAPEALRLNLMHTKRLLPPERASSVLATYAAQLEVFSTG